MALAKYYEDLLERQSENLIQIESNLNNNLNKNDLNRLKNQLMGDLRIMRTLVDDFMDLVTNPDNAEIIYLKNKIKSLQEICDEVTYDLFKDLKDDYNKLQSKYDNLNIEYKKLNKELIYKEGKIKYEKDKNIKLENKIKINDNKIKQLNNELLLLNNLRSDYNSLTKENQNLNKIIKDKDDEILMLYDEIEKMEKLAELSRNQKDIKEISLLRRENSELLDKLNKLSLDYDDKNKKIIQQNSIYASELKKKETTIKNLEQSINDLKKSARSHIKDIERLKMENNKSERKIVNLNAEMKRLECKIKQLEQSIIDVEKSKPRIISHKLNGETVIREMDIVGQDVPTYSRNRGKNSPRNNKRKIK